jgi:3'(2'), 5'-bisphosphate nucleotidase
MLGHAFPDDPIVAEENAAELRQGSGVPLRDRVVQLANETLTAKPEFDDDVAWGIGPGQMRTADSLLDAIDKGCHPGGHTGRKLSFSF